MSFYAGLLLLAVPINIFLIWSKDPSTSSTALNNNIGNWTNIVYTFRLFFFVFLIVLGNASCVQIFRAYKINYIYIFEINPVNQMTHYQIYTFGLLLFLVLNIFIMLQVIVFKFYWDFPNNSKVPTMMLTFVFLVMIMFNPLKVLYRVARMEICCVLGNLIIAPFGLVKFRHFFLGNVIESSKLMLNDMDAMICFYTSAEFASTVPIKCGWQINTDYFWNMVP